LAGSPTERCSTIGDFQTHSFPGTPKAAHRFSTVRMADLIVVQDSGRVAELGSHRQLMALGGLYAELFTPQARAYA
jgi:ATP-binding cassette subfamily B protein